MKLIRIAIVCATLLLSACASTEGIFEPACIAYEGDRIELRDGRFEWDRFTDVRNVDANGNVIDPFPEYPKSGRYDITAGQLQLETDAGERLPDHFLLKHDGQPYLLSEEQHELFLESGQMPDCALRLRAEK